MKTLRIALLLVLLASNAPTATAARFVVTNTNAGGIGSLRDAVNSAGSTSAPDTITFNIRGRGPHVINDAGLLLLYPVVIDGMSQPGAVPNTNPGDQPWNGTIKIQVDGTGIPGENVFDVGFPSSEIRGLSITGAEGGYGVLLGNAGGHKVASCFVGLDPSGQASADLANEFGGILAYSDGNEIGSSDFTDRNVIAGNWSSNIEIVGDDNVVRGNFIGLGPDGATAIFRPVPGVGVDVTGSDNIIGGAVGGGRNVISNNGSHGVALDGDRNIVRRNRIGTDFSGTLALANRENGVDVVSGEGNVIGGRVNGGDNLIGGNRRAAIYVRSSATGTIIRRNKIGVGVGDVPVPNSWGGGGLRHAVEVFGERTQIGGGQNGDGNHIAYNEWGGVSVLGFADGVTVRRNRIHDNFLPNNPSSWRPELDLGDDGVTPNDPGDVDGGPNGFQNFPYVSDINVVGSDMMVSGSIDAVPFTTYTIDFYRMTEASVTGHAGSHEWLGSETVTTTNIGLGYFTRTLTSVVPEGEFITTTATAPDGSTSEFSPTLEVVGLKVVRGSDSGYGSLRSALEYANANPGFDVITYDPSLTVELLSPLPTITDPVHLGSSAGGAQPTIKISGSGLFPGQTLLRVEADGSIVSRVEFIDATTSVCIRVDANDCQLEFIRVRHCPDSFGVLLNGSRNLLDSYFTDQGARNGVMVDGSDNSIERAGIYGCTESGILIRNGAANTRVETSQIGASGSEAMNQGWAILLEGAGAGTVVETTKIWGNVLGGVGVGPTSGATTIGGNSFFGNVGLAIDLGLDGVTPNDPADLDGGPNGLQNFPEIFYSYPSDGCLTIYGTVRTTADTDVRLDFYRTFVAHFSGYGEGQEHLGFTTVTTSGAGTGSFRFCAPGGVVDEFVTATATVAGQTSELSEAIEILDWLTVKSTATGEFVQALSIANQVPGLDTIRFRIGSPGPHRIDSLPIVIGDDLVIDGFSQNGSRANDAPRSAANTAQPMIELDLREIAGRSAPGASVGSAPVVEFVGARSTIRGVAILAGDPSNPAVRIGGTGQNSVEGCWIGVQADGAPWFEAQTQIEILAGSEQNVIGGIAFADQNVIASAYDTNVVVRSSGNRIEGNIIGLLPDGVTAPGFTEDGVVFAGLADGNVIGGTSPSARNTISGHLRDGVVLGGGSTVVERNVIGSDVTGDVMVPNASAGIRVASVAEQVIGGDNGASNRIVGNGGAGVQIDTPVTGSTRTAASGNEIFSNAGLGIDLGVPGVTPNSPSDDWVDAPWLEASYPDGGGWRFRGTVSGTPGQTATLEFFENAACDPSGHGEGEALVGSVDVVLGGGTEAFDVFLPGVILDNFAAATATVDHSTSEFSNCLAPVATGVPPPAIASTELHPNVPNPFNPRTELRFDLSEPAHVTMRVVDARGRRVLDLVGGVEMPVGRHAVEWDGRDAAGELVASGVYFAVLRAGEVTRTIDMVLVR